MKLLSDTKPVDKDELAQRNLVARSARLRQNGGYISYSGFKMRKDYLEDESKGKLREEVQNKSPMGPMGQMDMFKQQVHIVVNHSALLDRHRRSIDWPAAMTK